MRGWEAPRYTRGTETVERPDIYVHPIGTPERAHSYGDNARVYSILSPEGEWPGGLVKLELRISSKASTIRHKRIVVKKHVPVATNKKTEDAANSQL